MKPRLLDLFCGAGGAAAGYHLAGFDVTGIDCKYQPNYPFDFVQADAVEFLQRGVEKGSIRAWDVVHASPPCQGYSQLLHLPWLKDKEYPRLIAPILELLIRSGVPWVVENVENSWREFREHHSIILCGQSFNLNVYRHRLFASNQLILAPAHLKHVEIIGSGRMLNDRKKGTLNASSTRGSWGKPGVITVAGNQFRKADGARAMGIDWMSKPELAQAIPPAYTEHIGRQLMTALNS